MNYFIATVFFYFYTANSKCIIPCFLTTEMTRLLTLYAADHSFVSNSRNTAGERRKEKKKEEEKR